MIDTNKMLTEAFRDERKAAKLRIAFNGSQTVERDNLISAKLTETLADNNITIGSAFSQSFELTMRMPDEAIPLAGAYFTAEASFESEWVPLGTFYVSTVSTNDDYKTVSITATDRMALLTDSYNPGISLPATQKAIIEDIAAQYSLNLGSISYADTTITQLYEGSVRDYLGWLAGLSGANARFDRNGKLTFTWYRQIVARFGDVNFDDEINSKDTSYINENLIGSASTKEAEAILGRMIVGTAYIGAQITDSEKGPIADVNEDGIIDGKDVAEIQAYIDGTPYDPTTVGTIKDYVQALNEERVEKKGFTMSAPDAYTISALISGTDDNPLESGSGKAISFYNPLMTKGILDAIASKILPFTFAAAEVTFRGCPSWEIGDIARVKIGGNWDIPIMSQSMEFGEKLSAKIKSLGLTDEEESSLTVVPDTKEVQRQLPGIKQMITDINNSLLSGDTGYMILDETEIDGVMRLSGFKLMNTPTVTGVTKGWLANLNGIGWSSDGFKTISKLGLDMANGKIYADEIAAGSVITNSFKIGESDSDYAMSFNGSTGEITFGSKVKMSWASIEDQPDIPTSTSDLTNDSGFINSVTATSITNDAIESCTIRANQVEAGSFTMTGGTINIETGGKDVSKIKLSYDWKDETSYMELSDQGMVSQWTDGGLVASVYVKQECISVTGPFKNNYSSMTGAKIVENGTALSDKYARISHTHSDYYTSGSNIHANYLYIASLGNASVQALYCSTASGIVGTDSSSQRYKNSIADVTDEMLRPERLYNLPVRQFKWNEGHFDEAEHYDYDTINIGFIAEEMAEYYPYATVLSAKGEIESWEVRRILPAMLALIQEQHKDIEELKKKLEALS